ncbi:ABC transporter ATP-binding protein [Catenulispora subtropica]|uniref:ABC transporter ATP-binding protein n=1 Tax=Catenulispora subtropica TaxID=450798 RepID=A0ABN2R7K2_9ACTN
MADPAAAPAPSPSAGAVAATLARLIWRSARVLVAGLFLITVAEAVLPLVAAWLTKQLIDRLAGQGPVLGIAVPLAAAGVATACLPRIALYLHNEATRRIGAQALDDLFAASGRQVGLARFEDPAFLDRLRLARDGGNDVGRLLDTVFGLGRGALTLIGFVAVLLTISPVMTGLLLAAAVPMLCAELALSRRRATTRMRIEPHHRREFFFSQLLSGVQAAKELRVFGSGDHLRSLMMRERGKANAAQRRAERREVWVQSGLSTASATLAGGALVWAAVSARDGRLTLGDVSILVAAVASVQSALQGLVSSLAGLREQGLMAGAFVAVMRTEPDLPVAADPRPTTTLRRGIEIRDVWFRYSPAHPWVLRGVDLTIPAGTTVALVGTNGSGKSTLVKLLCRLYDPTEGAILWDGVDLRDLDPAELRARVGAVFQDFMAYDLSASENIAMGDVTALGDDGRLHDAARRAGVDGVLRALPHGYDTMLTRMFVGEDGEEGTVLSGGQWQRLALARGLLRTGRDLMILDEPSSGLDPEAEQEMHAALRAARLGRANLLISHRLSAVRDADSIAVLEGGRIVETGDHAGLLASDGKYAGLFRSQAAGYQLDAEPV